MSAPKGVAHGRPQVAGTVSSILLRLAVIDSGCYEPNTTLMIETLTDAPEGWVLNTPELERTDQVISRDSLATVVEEAVAWAISRRGRR
jgi:Fe-S cluster assembly iron-binding protein IscA